MEMILTLEECLDFYEKYGMRFEINDGNIVGTVED